MGPNSPWLDIHQWRGRVAILLYVLAAVGIGILLIWLFSPTMTSTRKKLSDIKSDIKRVIRSRKLTTLDSLLVPRILQCRGTGASFTGSCSR